MKRLITVLAVSFLLILPLSFAFAANNNTATNTNKTTTKATSADKSQTCDIEVGFEYEIEDLTVAFTNVSVGNWDNVVWEFGDGESSKNVKITKDGDAKYTYPKGGMYTFCLTAENVDAKCGEKFCGQLYVFD